MRFLNVLVAGPLQPYLAYNLETDTSTINLVWTLGFIGFLLGSLLIGTVFTRYITSSRGKLFFMFIVLLLTGLSTIVMPFMDNLPLLLLCRFLQVTLIQYLMILNLTSSWLNFQFLGYGIFVTADSVLLVYTLGPVKSRPFINALHFFISVGFLFGTFLVQVHIYK